MSRETHQVVVVGAGPVGLLSALGLAQRGVEVLVLEAAPGLQDSPRAAVYHWSVLEGLDALGVLADAEEEGFRNEDLGVYLIETGETAFLRSGPALRDETPYFYSLHLGQHQLAAIVTAHLARFDNAEVRFDARVVGVDQDGSGVTVTLETPAGRDQLSAAWVLGCDGAGSTVREALGLGFDGMTWPERLVATNIRYPFDRHGYKDTSMIVDPDNGAIVVRLSKDGVWRWTWAESAELPEESIGERLPGRLADLGLGDEGFEVVQASPYRMHQRAAAQMRAGRVLLVGDAAHATNPTGGLGLTSGLFDLYALVEPLSEVIAGADDRALDEWAQERRRIFLEIASPAASGFKQAVFSTRSLEERKAFFAGMKAGEDPEAWRPQLGLFKALSSRTLAPAA